MKKISFRLSTASNAIEIYNFLKDLKDIASSYYIILDRNIVEICGIPDPEIEKVIQILTCFFSIGIVHDSCDIEKHDISKNYFMSNNNIVVPSLNSVDLNVLATRFVENLQTNGVKHDKLVDYINNCISDMCPYITVIEKPQYSVGDIIRLNTVSDFYFEFNSQKSYVYCLLCNVPNQQIAYAVPILANADNVFAQHIVPVLTNDINPCLSKVKQPMAMIDYARYISTDKFEGIHAKASPSFVRKVKESLSSAFSFITLTDQVIIEAVKEATPIKPTRRVNLDDALSTVFESTLSCIPKGLTKKEKVHKFLSLIGFPMEPLIIDTFMAAYHVERITYDNLIAELQGKYKFSYESAMHSLKFTFSEWFAKHPEVKAAYPKLSILTLIKFFVKKV